MVTQRMRDGRYETILLGGRLDGDRFVATAEPDAQHESAIELAQIAARDERR